MLDSVLEPLGGAAALAATCPPAWVFLVLALPHLWYMCVAAPGLALEYAALGLLGVSPLAAGAAAPARALRHAR